jgi:CubicO group peptidase (beta-lactamase class C family)
LSEQQDNSAFAPPPVAFPAGQVRATAPALQATLQIEQTLLRLDPELSVPRVGGRDARLFPRVRLDFFTLDDVLVPVQWGQMVSEGPLPHTGPPSYWSVIPQFGRVWRDPAAEGGWSIAAFAVMLVNDLENHAHQGVARFNYRGTEVRDFCFQFVQQTTPYLLKHHFLAWGAAPVRSRALEGIDLQAARDAARRELNSRLPTRSLQEELDPSWIVAEALVRPGGPLYYQTAATPCGAYPYPLEMRFGVRSIMKSIAAPLSLLRLAQLHGPDVLDLEVGRYVSGLHEKFNAVRFIDAANMATGFGGTGTLRAEPNDFNDGYLEADYDGWYTAPSHEEKLAHMGKWLGPYPWAPGTVLRYRDNDYYVLGAAIDGYLKSIRGADADIWDMLVTEVFTPIGIHRAPTTRTREPDGARGTVWFNAGYFPTLDDLAKIALLYQSRGEWGGQQILHRELTSDLLSGRGVLPKQDGTSRTHYRMGFHFKSVYSQALQQETYVPAMWGSGESEIMLHPDGLVCIRIAKAAGMETRVSR